MITRPSLIAAAIVATFAIGASAYVADTVPAPSANSSTLHRCLAE